MKVLMQKKEAGVKPDWSWTQLFDRPSCQYFFI